MVLTFIAWLWVRLRPREGWLPLFLLWAAVGCLVGAVLDVRWVPETRVVLVTAVLGLFLGMGLAKRPISPLPAWSLLIIYGLLLTIVYLAHLNPPFTILSAGWAALRPYWLGQIALFLDRAGSWFVAVWANGRSEETIVFAFGLGLLTWVLAAYAAWSTFRQKRPLLGLTLMGVALSVNGYFGSAPDWWAAIFVALVGPLAAIMYFIHLSQEWDTVGVDYSTEIWLELLLYAAGIGLTMLMLSMILPSFSITRLAQAFQQQPVVQAAEQVFQEAFAGVAQPRSEAEVSPGGPGGSGLMPRTYLLGNAPELYETVVMTATVADVTNFESLSGFHWRGLSYDVYTGQGWSRSEEREERIAANQPIPLPTAQKQILLEQQVHWILDERLLHYALGYPVQFDEEVVTFWRGLEDLARVQGEHTTYRVTSQVSAATPDDLRQTAVANIPPLILARYTALPSISPRISELAQQVAGAYTSPYDQARAIEQFLRQYPYSLEVELPPPGVDPVEFFLFDLQTGYCDYYASAMVVMARSLGIPARLAIGYLGQPPDENGVQTIYQINGHAWAEVYFADYGWVEFEPTAAFPSTFDSQTTISSEFPLQTTATPPPIPESNQPSNIPWGRFGLLVLLAVGFAAFWWQQQLNKSEGDVVWAYGRLQAQARVMGQPTPLSQTPYEFLQAFTVKLAEYGRQPRWASLIRQVQPIAEWLTNLFVQQQYAGRENADITAVKKAWNQVKRPFLFLRIVGIIKKPKYTPLSEQTTSK